MSRHTAGTGTGYTMPTHVSFVDGNFVDDEKILHTWVGMDGRLYGGKGFCEELARRYNSQRDLLAACVSARQAIALDMSLHPAWKHIAEELDRVISKAHAKEA